MNFFDEIEIYLRSRFTVIWIASYEEDRITATLKTLCERSQPQRRLFTWDIAAYFKPMTDTGGANLPEARAIPRPHSKRLPRPTASTTRFSS